MAKKDTYEPTSQVTPGSVLKIGFAFLAGVVALHVVSFALRPKVIEWVIASEQYKLKSNIKANIQNHCLR